jgi:uncharacterized membrane protein YhaH (DUF805 family)
MSLFRLFCDFDGRIGLRAFWAGSVAVALATFSLQRTAPLLLDRSDAQLVIAFANAFALFPLAALAAKRACDRGGSSLFGILLVCAIVLPEQARPLLSIGWRPSLEAITTVAWVVALIDLGLMPSARQDAAALAVAPAGAKAAE